LYIDLTFLVLQDNRVATNSSDLYWSTFITRLRDRHSSELAGHVLRRGILNHRIKKQEERIKQQEERIKQQEERLTDQERQIMV
jgi:hypothetical protein